MSSDSDDTLRAQYDVEQSLLHFADTLLDDDDKDDSTHACDTTAAAPAGLLARRAHLAYLKTMLRDVRSSSSSSSTAAAATHAVAGPNKLSLYAAQPWVVYWTLQAADLLGVTEQLYAHVPRDAIAQFLYSCLSTQAAVTTMTTTHDSDSGSGSDADDDDDAAVSRPLIGFAGGADAHMPHLVSSYAACCALCILGDADYLRALPRAAIKRWLLYLRNEHDGSFRVHDGGESDVRASYCAAVLVTLLGLDEAHTLTTPDADDVRHTRVLTPATAHYVASCAAHEGGFACGAEAAEAHGAYTHCGLAALLLMRQPQLVRVAAARRWLAARQLAYEGGFNGRTNKLVDACYSYWVGAAHVLLRLVECCRALPHRALTARQVFLLGHAQLLDMDSLLVPDEDDDDDEAAEARASHEEQYVQRLLSRDDACRRDALAARAHCAQLHRRLTLADGDEGGCGDGDDGDVATSQPCEDDGDYDFDQRRLQTYVLHYCQRVQGGLYDKPGCAPDAYHTCYALAGLSAAQNLHYAAYATSQADYARRAFAHGRVPRHDAGDGDGGTTQPYGVVLLRERNAHTSMLRSSNPIYNMHPSRVRSALAAWGRTSLL